MRIDFVIRDKVTGELSGPFGKAAARSQAVAKFRSTGHEVAIYRAEESIGGLFAAMAASAALAPPSRRRLGHR